MTATVHVPILVAPIVEALVGPLEGLPEQAPSHWIVDLTLGGGGHTGALLEALAAKPSLSGHKVLSLDQDPAALARAESRFAGEIAQGRLIVRRARFTEAEATIRETLGEQPVLGMMADLGFSSDQLEDAGRGLSFLREGPLDMRMDPSRGASCRDYLLRVTEKELQEVLQEYGEERFSKRIASAIVNARREKRLPQTTGELARLIASSVPPPARHGRIHAATRTFQALRIVVNDEMSELDCLLEHVILLLKPGGRVAILSFHSLEDRKVKNAFRSQGSEQQHFFRALTKKPMEASEDEVRQNPRARSAKLRVAERI